MLNVKEAFETHGNYLLGAALILVFLVIGAVWFFKGAYVSQAGFVCGDNTLYDTCSEDKPYFCEEKILIEKASVCGCPVSDSLDFIRQEDFCISVYHRYPKDVNLTYVLDGEKKETVFTVFEGIKEYVSKVPRGISGNGGNVSRLDFKIKALNNSLQRETILPLVKKIQNLAPRSKVNQARIVISLVQNIPYGYSNETLPVFQNEINYSRYPYEVLYDGEGICGEKSQLLALLLKELGYKTAIFYFQEENHEVVGIGCPEKESFNRTGFCFVETSGPSIISDSGIEYVGGVKLESSPEVLIISDGISLPKGIGEYGDAKDLEDIREKNFLGFLKQGKKDDLEEKYNLADVYNLE